MTNKGAGFTLVEIALSLLVISILLAGLLLPMGDFLRQQKQRQTAGLLEQTKDALRGFAAAYNRLPCPATKNSKGEEILPCDSNDTKSGFVPYRSLGLQGALNAKGLLIDAWGTPLLYAVSEQAALEQGQDRAAAMVTTAGEIVWAVQNHDGIVKSGLPASGLVVCRSGHDDPDAPSSGCASTNSIVLAERLPVVIYSLGENAHSSLQQREAGTLHVDEWENIDKSTAASGAELEDLILPGDTVFVLAEHVDFDDQVVWLSIYSLYMYMQRAGHAE